MKTINYKIWVIALLISVLLPMSCTDNFEEYNTNPNRPQSGPIEGIMAGVQYFAFAEPRFITWRGNLIYSSRFAHQFSFNFAGTWFGSDPYQNNGGWTNGVFDNSYQKVSLNIRDLLRTYVKENNKVGAAIARIIMSWFYQKMTDVFGDVPYKDVIGEELVLKNPLPRYDPQKDIYSSIIKSLKEQMDIIGSSTTIIPGSAGDFMYKGDPQKWKAFANTLRLRMAIRAHDKDNSMKSVITECLAETLITSSSQALVPKSKTPLNKSNLDGGLEDVYWGFGGFGSKWVFSDIFIDLLKNNNDPRLSEMAVPSKINKKYLGSSVLSRSKLKPDTLSAPSVKIIGTSITGVDNMLPTQVLTAAESFFLQAEAAIIVGQGDANKLYQSGIKESMAFWGVKQADIDKFIKDEAIATLSGDNANKLKMIWNQRWLALLTNGYEAWALVRRTDMIPDFTDNTKFFVTSPNNGVVPKRLPYSATEAVSNKKNLEEAVARQGANAMTTNVWWDVK